jgi:cytochrome c
MKVSTVSTLWDYINRAMPWTSPKSLSVEEVYSVVAYLLNLGDIVPGDFTLSDRNIAEVQQRLPNRNGTYRDHGLWDVKGKPDVRNVACMKDCPLEAKVVSVLPEHARGAHGNLSEQYRPVGPTRGTDTSVVKIAEAAAPAAASPMLELAKAKTCLACHGVDKAVVGPAFHAIAAKYRGNDAALARLAAKVRAGGNGIWGAVPMPPNAAVTDEDARSLVQWILSGAE